MIIKETFTDLTVLKMEEPYEKGIYSINIVGYNTDKVEVHKEAIMLPVTFDEVQAKIYNLRDLCVDFISCCGGDVVEVSDLNKVNETCEALSKKGVSKKTFDFILNTEDWNLAITEDAIDMLNYISSLPTNDLEDAMKQMVLNEFKELTNLREHLLDYIDFRGIAEDTLSQYMSWEYDEEDKVVRTVHF